MRDGEEVRFVGKLFHRLAVKTGSACLIHVLIFASVMTDVKVYLCTVCWFLTDFTITD